MNKNLEKEGYDSMVQTETAERLVKKALEARKNAYAPYSRFRVGAALLAESGIIYTGCNIENAAYGPSNCAERTAFFKAVSEGERSFLAIAVAGAGETDNGQYTSPCGVCRQVMAEFCRPEEFDVIMANTGGEYCVKTLGELLPDSFGAANLKMEDAERRKNDESSFI